MNTNQEKLASLGQRVLEILRSAGHGPTIAEAYVALSDVHDAASTLGLLEGEDRCTHAGCHAQAVRIVGYRDGTGILRRGKTCGNHSSDKGAQ